MSFAPCPYPFADPEAVASASRYVQREWGETGYRVAIEAAGAVGCVLRVHHFDGSEFRVMADRYGNAWALPDLADLAEAVGAGTATEQARRAEAFARIDAGAGAGAVVTDHEHLWGPLEVARFTGTPHRKCCAPDCRDISLDFDDDDDTGEEVAR